MFEDEIEKDFFGYLPELPLVAERFIELTKEIKVSRRSYANLILSDPILSSRLFSYINLTLNPGNSGYFSLNKGIALMGLHAFKNVVTAFALFPVFEEANCVELFKYSLLTAYIAQAISAEHGFINKHDAFLLGFLHDVGKLALKNKFGEKYLIAPFSSNKVADENSIEKEIENFKYSHADISEHICKSWNFPLIICNAIKYHHNPLEAKLPQAASIIYISDILAKNETSFNEDSFKIFQYMQMSKSSLLPIIAGWQRKLSIYFEILGI